MVESQRREVVEKFLDGKKVVMFGRSYDLLTNKEEAIEFLVGVWYDLDTLADSQ